MKRKVQSGGADFLSTDGYVNIWRDYINPLTQEQVRLLPDSLLFGSAILALVTQSFSMAIFFLTLIETAGINYGIQTLFTYMDRARLLPTLQSATPICRSGFVTKTAETFTSLVASDVKSSFPSPSLFFLSTASAYIIGSLYSLQQELEALGPEYSSRFYIAVYATFLLLLGISFYRLYNGCETVGIVTMSLIAGGLVGGLLLVQNMYLFGRDSINLIGIPLLIERTADKKPIYICPQKVSSS